MITPNADPEDHYLLCISRTRDTNLKARLKSESRMVAEMSKVYHACAAQGGLHDYSPAPLAQADHGDLRAVYTRGMLQKEGPGRELYDRIRLSAPNQICPFCGRRHVSGLDHYLPRETFPELSVLPANLVPACADCNNDKGTYRPKSASDHLFHPYFHKLGEERWLLATVVEESGGPALRFRVDAPSSWSAELESCVRQHLKVLRLYTLYGVSAASEIVDIGHRVQVLRTDGGPPAVRAHLLAEAESREVAHPNSWKTATYFALAESEMFCDGAWSS